MGKKNNEYTGVLIPNEVLKIHIKNGNEKILFSMILMLSKNGSCTASNGYLSERLQLSKGQISRLISELQNKNLVNIFVDRSNGNNRKITINKMSKLKEVFEQKNDVLNEIERLEKVFQKNGSVIASYPEKIKFSKETQNQFESAGFLVEDKDVAGKNYSVVSKNNCNLERKCIQL